MPRQSRRPPGRPKTAQSNKPTNHLILQTALQLFLNEGYQKVSVDDISKACGITKATVYYYYESKSVLFTEAMLAMMDRIRMQISSMLKADKPLKERLYDVAEGHLKATTSFDLDGFMRETKTTLSSEQTKKMKEAEEKMYEAIGEALQEAKTDGLINDVPTVFAAHSYVAMLNVGHYQLKDGSRLFASPSEAARQIVDFYWSGLTHSP